MNYEFEHVRDITKVILFVLFLCLLSCSSVCVMRFFNSSGNNLLSGSCCKRVHGKHPLITLAKFLTAITGGTLQDEQSSLLAKIPTDKFFVPEYYDSAAGYGAVDGNRFTPIYDKNGDNVLVKHDGNCYFLFFYSDNFYRSAIPASSCTTWKSSLSLTENSAEKYKFTDFAQLCSC